MDVLNEVIAGIATLAALAGLVALAAWFVIKRLRKRSITGMLKEHFHGKPFDRIAVTERMFPLHIRADLQRAVNDFLAIAAIRAFVGVTSQHGFGGVDFATLLDEGIRKMSGDVVIGPPQYEEIDVGEDEPVQTLKNGLWLLEKDGTRLALLYAPHADYSACGISQRIRIQVAVEGDEMGQRVSREFFRHMERGVLDARSYRGKVLSFEQESEYSGKAAGVKVHRLRAVRREDVVLPARTLELLDRNVLNFVGGRGKLHAFRMSTKKGLLFYGPPGTGKTHTIRYLAGALKGHTTFLISAEQVGLLGEYMTLARLLQPSMVVIEDVDLLARERTQMQNAATELLLNKLLNEMDGLREDADILFILTTNRPEELEAALASRPGRIDQAIEFPFPDVTGREKLVRLYSHGLAVSDELTADIVNRTENVSASFIKELMRRAAQFNIERNGDGNLIAADVASALDEMLFSGGSLNLKLLGAQDRVEPAEEPGDAPRE